MLSLYGKHWVIHSEQRAVSPVNDFHQITSLLFQLECDMHVKELWPMEVWWLRWLSMAIDDKRNREIALCVCVRVCYEVHNTVWPTDALICQSFGHRRSSFSNRLYNQIIWGKLHVDRCLFVHLYMYILMYCYPRIAKHEKLPDINPKVLGSQKQALRQVYLHAATERDSSVQIKQPLWCSLSFVIPTLNCVLICIFLIFTVCVDVDEINKSWVSERFFVTEVRVVLSPKMSVLSLRLTHEEPGLTARSWANLPAMNFLNPSSSISEFLYFILHSCATVWIAIVESDSVFARAVLPEDLNSIFCVL